jgi:hypothetical protein
MVRARDVVRRRCHGEMDSDFRPARRAFRGALSTELITWLRICQAHAPFLTRRNPMGGLIYLIGLIVVVMFILSFLGLR